MKRKKLAGILCGAGIAAAVLFGINRLAFLLATGKNILTSGDMNKYSWRFGSIYYSKKGKGEPVLLLHGMDTGSSAYEWKGMVASLAESHTVYVMDLPGYGRSEKGRMLYTNYLYVEAVTSFIREVAGKKTAVITSGASSSIAVMAARKCPDRIGSMVLIAPETPDGMISRPGGSRILLSRMMRLPLAGTFAYVLASSRFMIGKKLREADPGRTDRDAKGTAAAFWEGAHLGGPNARFQFSSRLAGYTKMNVFPALKELRNPICMIYGSEDPEAEKTLDVYRHFAPGVRAVKIQNAKSRPHLAHPGRIAAFCSEFIRQHGDAEDRSYIRILH